MVLVVGRSIIAIANHIVAHIRLITVWEPSAMETPYLFGFESLRWIVGVVN